ncbi:peptidoglycan recognition family protein [Planctomycetota bacterium]
MKVKREKLLNVVVVFCGFSLVLSGCSNDEILMPEITHDYSSTSIPIIPEIEITTPTPSSAVMPASWIPPSHLKRRWTAIMIHHSATKNGNATIFDRWHREDRNWDGIGYDFVIGNGTDSPNGQVEVTFRWRQQRTGAHCGGTPGNWANESGIGICLVGDFSKSAPTRRQMNSLLQLVRFLQKRFSIPRSRIYGHKDVPGAHITNCPGSYFPMAQLKSMLD